MSDNKNTKDGHEHHHDQKHHEEIPIVVDQQHFKWPVRNATGLELKELVHKTDKSLWMKVNGPHDDKLIADNEEVDLEPKDHRHFFTGDCHTTEG